jgi:metallo-beta-lactamase class B
MRTITVASVQSHAAGGGRRLRLRDGFARLAAGAALAAASGAGLIAQSTVAPDVQRHIDAARKAAGVEHAAMVDRLCPVAPPSPAAPAAGGAGRQGGSPAAPPPRESWYAEPARVFDNLFFVGMTGLAAWAIPTSEGVIVIDPVFDYSVEASVVEGLTKLGLDPAMVKYVLVSHGHGDHAGGARLLQSRYGARVLMAAADWDLLEQQNPPWLPKRDMIVTDGQTLTLGDTTITMYLTPGHTDGTVSTFIPVRDGAARHVAFLWGGTLFNFGPDRARFEAYANAAARMRTTVAMRGADVLLSNHTGYDGTRTKLPALQSRRAGQRHPFVVGTGSLDAFLNVANECAQAALATLPAR